MSPPATPTLLITGFEPFAHYTDNPSGAAAMDAAARFPGRVIARRLRVDHHAAREQLLQALEETAPTACLCLGQAPSDEFRLEQLARKPHQFAHWPGDASHRGTFVWEMVEHVLTSHGVAHYRSEDAGQYVCESTYWALLDAVRRGHWSGPAGFLHVPASSALWPMERTSQIVTALVARWVETTTVGDGSSSLPDALV